MLCDGLCKFRYISFSVSVHARRFAEEGNQVTVGIVSFLYPGSDVTCGRVISHSVKGSVAWFIVSSEMLAECSSVDEGQAQSPA